MRDIGLLILRVGFSINMLRHGTMKFIELMQENYTFANPIGIGEAPSFILTTFAEFICPMLIIVGFKTRWASIPIVFTMLIAAFVQHFSESWGNMEKALLYLIGFTAIALLGPGKYSIDGTK